jgi:drug/metabolite transporter (DMT)-like permease
LRKKRVPTHAAALLLSLEAVIGAIGGIWLLGEQMTLRMLMGAALMMAAIFVAQFRPSMAKVKLIKKPG